MESSLMKKVVSALVGGTFDAHRTFVREVATGNHSLEDIVDVAKELVAAEEESRLTRK